MKRLERLYSILKAVKKIHRLIFESKDVDSLISGICRCFTELQHYFYAWIVLLDDRERVLSSCEVGQGDDFRHIQEKLQAGKISGPLRKVLKGERFVKLENNLHLNRQAIITALSYKERTYGILGVAIDPVLAENEEELGLLKDIAEETSFALHNLIREEELEKSREWLITTMNSIGDAVIATDISSKLVLMNGVAESLTGYSAGEVKGRDIKDFFYIKNEKTGEKAEIPVERVIRENRIIGLANHTILITKDGYEIPIDDSASPIRDKTGNIIGTVLIFRDVSDRRKTENELRFQSMLLNQIQDRITATDLEGNITYVNEAECKMFAKSRDELIGKNVRNYGEDTDRGPGQEEIIEKTKANGQWRGEIVNYTDSGESVILDSRTRIIYDDRQKPIGLVGISTDVTAHKRMEEALKDKNTELEEILDAVPDAIVYADTNRRISKVNPAFTSMYGYSDQEVIGKETKILYADEEEYEKQGRLRYNVEAVHKYKPYEVRYRREDGSSFLSETVGTPVRNTKGKTIGFLALIRDITERKRIENDIQTALNEKEVLLRELYHRTKNNMQVIASMISLLRIRINDKDLWTRLKELEGKIYSMALVHEKLYQSGSLSKINIKEYIEDLVGLISSSFGEKTEKIFFSLDLDTFECYIDIIIPLGLVINELITNALKYAFEDRERGTISISVKKKDDLCRLTIADNGKGLPDTLNPETADTLGFQTVYTIIKDQLNGSIEVESAKGTRWNIVVSRSIYSERLKIGE